MLKRGKHRSKKRKFKINLKNKNTVLTIAIIGALFLVILVLTIGWVWSVSILAISLITPFIIEYGSRIKNVFKKIFGKKKKYVKTKKAKISKKTIIRKKGKKKRKKRKILKIGLIGLLILGILGVITGIGLMIYVATTAPKFNPENLYSQESTLVYDSENNVIAELGIEKRENVTFDELPEVFLDAIIATEDSRFYQHNGFDLPRFAKATLDSIKAVEIGASGGGSTLTMQVAKNSFTSTKQTIMRKLTDIYLSIFKLEKEYTKEEIIEFYVNTPYLGGGSYGVEQACRSYFGKSVSDINLSEAALIAGMFQAPGAYDPFIYPEKAESRRLSVLSLMKKHGYINQEQYDIAKIINVEKIVVGNNSNVLEYQGYLDAVIEEVIDKTEYNPYDVPMEIYTNMVKEKQDHAKAVCNDEVYEFRNDVVQTGFVVTDVNNGKIVAIGAGRNRDGERSFNYATMINRQPGSTAKPLFDYGPGFEFNNWSTYYPLLDEKYTYSNGKPISNWDGRHWGLLTLREAFKQSRNIPALKAFQQVDNVSIVSFVTSLGITPEIDSGRIHEAHAIGGFNGVSPLEMSGAYAAFANGGYYTEPYTVSKIVFKNTGDVIEYKPQKERVMKGTTAFLVTNVLNGSLVSGVQMSSKTGTTNLDDATEKKYGLPRNAVQDAWVIGYTPNYSIAMWYGYDKITSEYYLTTTTAWADRKPLFQDIAKGMVEYDGKRFPSSSGVRLVTVEKETIPAMLPSEYTPSGMKITEYFIKGTEPTERSPRYSSLNEVTGLDGHFNNNTKQITLTWDELPTPSHLTDSYLNNYFRSGYGTFKDKYLNIRLAYNTSTMGTIGYYVYLKNSSTGALTLLDFTTENTFVHSISSPGETLSYVVRTGYQIFTSNKSDGIELTISISDAVFVNMSLNGDPIVSLAIDEIYTEPDPSVIVIENLIDVTNLSTIVTTITRDSDDTIVLNIDTSSPETYTIEYDVTYDTHSQTLTRNIIVE